MSSVHFMIGFFCFLGVDFDNLKKKEYLKSMLVFLSPTLPGGSNGRCSMGALLSVLLPLLPVGASHVLFIPRVEQVC